MAVLLGILAVLAFGIIPMVVYAIILWWFDRYEKEPLGLLVAAFLWGAVPSIIFSLVTQIILDLPIRLFVSPGAANLFGAVVTAPITEEFFKGLALLLLFIFFRHEIDTPLDGIIYGGLVGFGFAAVENVFYFTESLLSSGMGGLAVLSILRAFVFGLNHALFTGLTGLGIALAYTSPNRIVRIVSPIGGLLLGMIAHSVHNLAVSLGSELVWPCLIALIADWGGVLVLLVVIVWTILRERHWIETHLEEEVDRGTLSREHYEVASSTVQRTTAQIQAFFDKGFHHWLKLSRYYRLATELAFSKHRLTRFPEDDETQERIETLRQKVSGLEAEVA